MEIYLIRHTTPAIRKGQCYGQADLDVTESFEQEARCIRPHLPPQIRYVFSSPLQRCRKLAEYLFPQHHIHLEDRLKEINCGEWELRLWDEIDSIHLKRWMDDQINVCIPGGESYLQLYERVVQFFHTLPQNEPVALVAHGGVLRSILSHIAGITLADSFHHFQLRYGCVVRVNRYQNHMHHQVLHNPPAEQEQHRPSYY